MSGDLDEMRAVVRRGEGFSKGHLVLRGWKQKGLSRGRAREALAQLRAESLTDPEDDALLELLDVVEGWCRPELLVWLDGEG